MALHVVGIRAKPRINRLPHENKFYRKDKKCSAVVVIRILTAISNNTFWN